MKCAQPKTTQVGLCGLPIPQERPSGQGHKSACSNWQGQTRYWQKHGWMIRSQQVQSYPSPWTRQLTRLIDQVSRRAESWLPYPSNASASRSQNSRRIVNKSWSKSTLWVLRNCSSAVTTDPMNKMNRTLNNLTLLYPESALEIVTTG